MQKIKKGTGGKGRALYIFSSQPKGGVGERLGAVGRSESEVRIGRVYTIKRWGLEGGVCSVEVG